MLQKVVLLEKNLVTPISVFELSVTHWWKSGHSYLAFPEVARQKPPMTLFSLNTGFATQMNQTHAGPHRLGEWRYLYQGFVIASHYILYLEWHINSLAIKMLHNIGSGNDSMSDDAMPFIEPNSAQGNLTRVLRFSTEVTQALGRLKWTAILLLVHQLGRDTM